MVYAQELAQIAPGLLLWQAYDPTVKADLFSTAIVTDRGLYLVDPIPLAAAGLAELRENGGIAGIVLTNGNHLRAAAEFAGALSVPIFARPEAFPDEPRLGVKTVSDGDWLCDELRVIAIEGAAAGEIVLYHAPRAGTLIIGDALINFEPYGFTILPSKYCQDSGELRRSLRTLLSYKAGRMLFAHGEPILTEASERLQRLLDS